MSAGERSVLEPATQQIQRVRPRREAGDTSDLSETPPPPRRDPDADAFPNPGETVSHYELVEELGRGSFARVYLARQESLANRLVVVKVTTAPTDEPQNLARFQHTNVVPVYSAHAAGPLQVLCMPYLGRVTLAQILAHPAADRRRSGRGLLGPVLSHSAAPPPSPALTDALAALDKLSPVGACLWFVGQLAAGLGHAHARHILHRDLKPANVLVTDDGVPMLLDFNVSCESARGSGGTVGGTLPYMAPEHLRAFLDPDVPLDERSDLYSLGVILYELLADRLPYPLPDGDTSDAVIRRMVELHAAPPPPPSRFNPAVTPAVDAIVGKLLAADPAGRYATAADLRDDLTRQLADRPLTFAPNPSLRERAAKWRRRNPTLATAGLAFALLVLPASFVAAHQADLEARTVRLQRAAAAGVYLDTAAGVRDAETLLGSKNDPAARGQGLARGADLLARYGVGDDPAWEARPEFALLDEPHRAALKAGFAELLVLMARAEPGVPAAERWNTLAGPLFADAERPAVLARQREEFAARKAGQPPPALKPLPADATDADLYFEGLDLVATDRFADALPLLVAYCDRRPTHFLAWFTRGLCHDALNHPADAYAAFALCVALRPDSAAAHVNRGIANRKLRRFAAAAADFTRGLELKPNWRPALFNRGLAREGLRQYAAADADFAAALADPDAPTRILFAQARVRKANGDPAGAAEAKKEAMARQPNDALSWAARGTEWLAANQPDKALADFDTALEINPVLSEALMNKAIVLADHLHREADAIPVLDVLVRHYPDNADARGSRGVYHARLGHVAEARRDADAALRADPSAYRQFQIAGLHAQLAKADAAAKDAALLALARAVRAGFTDVKLLKSDTDLDPVRSDPRFAELVDAVRKLDTLSRPTTR